jgi:hypothetical protein
MNDSFGRSAVAAAYEAVGQKAARQPLERRIDDKSGPTGALCQSDMRQKGMSDERAKGCEVPNHVHNIGAYR